MFSLGYAYKITYKLCLFAWGAEHADADLAALLLLAHVRIFLVLSPHSKKCTDTVKANRK